MGGEPLNIPEPRAVVAWRIACLHGPRAGELDDVVAVEVGGAWVAPKELHSVQRSALGRDPAVARFG